jgi:uncharacterized membrane protein
MAFCPNCGASIGDGAAFCAACGSSTRPEAAPVSNVAVSGGPAAAAAISTGMQSNVAGALAYIFGIISAVIFLVLDQYKNDRSVRFHAFQSLFFGLAWIAFWFAWMFVWGILTYATGGFLFFVRFPLGMLLGLGGFLYWLFLMYKAYNNEMYRIPFIGDLAAKQAGV